MDLPDPLILISPGDLSGAPVFNGTRVPIQALFDYIEGGDPLDEFLEDFPNVSREHAIAVLKASRAALIEASSATETYQASAEELAAIAEAEAQLARGERVPKAEVDAFWRRHGL